MKDTWHNNKISKRLNEEYPHDFSICDIDGVCRHNNKQDPDDKKRLIMYESKVGDEPASPTQLETLYDIKKSIKWENYDDKSGVCLIRHDYDAKYLTIYKIEKRVDPMFYCTEEVTTSTLDEFYKLISRKDNDLDLYFSNQSFT